MLHATNSSTLVDHLYCKRVVGLESETHQTAQYFQALNLLSDSHRTSDHTEAVESKLRFLPHPFTLF